MSNRKYAALWSDDGQRPLAGTLVMAPTGLRLEGSASGRRSCRRIAYENIESLHLGRAGAERLGGRPVLVLDLGHARPRLRIAAPEQGALYELAEALVHLTHEKGRTP
jgi:hypothetical protein